MDVLLVVCHPIAESFNHAVARALSDVLLGAGHRAELVDLYAERFDPVLPREELLSRTSFDAVVSRHMEKVERSGGLVIVHPDWWGWPPALLVGWIDRVFRQGIAYEYEGEEFLAKHRMPLLTGRRAAVVVTTDRDPGDASGGGTAGGPETGPAEHPLVGIWRDQVLGFCGFERPEVRIVWSVRRLSAAERRREIARAADMVRDW